MRAVRDVLLAAALMALAAVILNAGHPRPQPCAVIGLGFRGGC